jgi:hypothetical protein
MNQNINTVEVSKNYLKFWIDSLALAMTKVITANMTRLITVTGI